MKRSMLLLVFLLSLLCVLNGSLALAEEPFITISKPSASTVYVDSPFTVSIDVPADYEVTVTCPQTPDAFEVVQLTKNWESFDEKKQMDVARYVCKLNPLQIGTFELCASLNGTEVPVSATRSLKVEPMIWTEEEDEIIVPMGISSLFLVHSAHGKPVVTCLEDEEAMTIDDNAYWYNKQGFTIYRVTTRFTKLGDYTLRFSTTYNGKSYDRDILVHVKECITGMHFTKPLLYVKVGDTVDTGLVFDGGIFTGSVGVSWVSEPYMQNRGPGTFSDDGSTFTATQQGYSKAHVAKYSFSDDVVVVVYKDDMALPLTLKSQQDGAVVDENAGPLYVEDANGNRVFAFIGTSFGGIDPRVNITRLYTYLLSHELGPVTLYAFAPDGTRSDPFTVTVSKKAQDFTLNTDGLTLQCGETFTLQPQFAQGEYAPVTFKVVPGANEVPGLEGECIYLNGNEVKAYLPGTCQIQYSMEGGQVRTIPVTVVDSPDRLSVKIPTQPLVWGESFTTAASFKGQPISVNWRNSRYAIAGSSKEPVHQISEDGVITAFAAGLSKIVGQLSDGYEFSFFIETTQLPTLLAFKYEAISIPQNKTVALSELLDYNQAGSLVFSSSDPSVATVNTYSMKLVPQGQGIAIITVSDIRGEMGDSMVVEVTEPIYVESGDIHFEDLPLYAASGYTTALPRLLDAFGNEVPAAYYVTAEWSDRSTRSIYLTTEGKFVLGNKVKCSYSNASGEITAVTEDGAITTERIYCYKLASSFKLVCGPWQEAGPCTMRVGSSEAINVRTEDDSTVHNHDATITMKGDKDAFTLSDDNDYGWTISAKDKGTVTVTVTARNGKSASIKITSELNPYCAQNGHTFSWRTSQSPTAYLSGEEEYRCTWCGLITERRPAKPTGTLFLSANEVTLMDLEGLDSAYLTAWLSGQVYHCFSWQSSDPSVVMVVNGALLAMGPGTAEVTATCGDVVSAPCKVKVLSVDGETLSTPSQTVTIEKNAFRNSGIVAAQLNNGLKSIGAGAFADCRLLQVVRIPASVETIAEDAFSGCTVLRYIQCTRGSAAEAFAAAHGISIVYIND